MRVFHLILALALMAGSQAVADSTGSLPPDAVRGPVTNLPLPRFVSMKASKGYARRGPGRTNRIDWVYTNRGQPLEITAEYGNWRRVQDQDGAGGWMHYSLLSGVRTAVIETDMVAMRRAPNNDAMVSAKAELGVVARLDACKPDWCRISAGGQSGWVPKTALWGVFRDESFN